MTFGGWAVEGTGSMEEPECTLTVKNLIDQLRSLTSEKAQRHLPGEIEIQISALVRTLGSR